MLILCKRLLPCIAGGWQEEGLHTFSADVNIFAVQIPQNCTWWNPWIQPWYLKGQTPICLLNRASNWVCNCHRHSEKEEKLCAYCRAKVWVRAPQGPERRNWNSSLSVGDWTEQKVKWKLCVQDVAMYIHYTFFFKLFWLLIFVRINCYEITGEIRTREIAQLVKCVAQAFSIPSTYFKNWTQWCGLALGTWTQEDAGDLLTGQSSIIHEPWVPVRNSVSKIRVASRTDV